MDVVYPNDEWPRHGKDPPGLLRMLQTGNNGSIARPVVARACGCGPPSDDGTACSVAYEQCHSSLSSVQSCGGRELWDDASSCGSRPDPALHALGGSREAQVGDGDERDGDEQLRYLQSQVGSWRKAGCRLIARTCTCDS